VARDILPTRTSARTKAAPITKEKKAKRHRLGAWVGQESYVDKNTGERKKNVSWTVKYRRSDRKPGDYRQVVERGFATEADAEAWWAVQKANAHRPVAKAEVIKQSAIHLGDFLESWLKTKRVSIGAGAYRQYESHVREHLIPSLGNLLLVELERNPQVIEDAMASWKRKDGREGHLSPLFIKKVWSTLRTALNKAKKLQHVATNPCTLVDPPKVERKEMKWLDPSQVRQHLDAFDKTTIGAAIATALGSGCRCGELLALRWRDVSLSDETLRVEHSLERVAIRTATRTRYELRFKEPKTKKSRRTIPLTAFAVDRLKRYRIEQAQRLMAAGVRPDGDTLVFDNDGQPWVPTSFGMLYARLRDEAALTNIGLHGLRHTFASLLLLSGADLKTVSTALGHSSVAITADLYAHISPVMLRSAADRLNDLIEKQA
jgi:integrase